MASHEPDSVATVPSQILNNMLQDLIQTGRSPQTSPIAKPPRLESSKSAPPPDTENGLSESTPSQNRFATLTRALSLGYGGDTQELNSQELAESKELLESMRHPHSMTTPQTLQRTQREGDNAFINLESEWSVPSQQVFEEEFLHETQTPAVPMTPAIGRETDRDTRILTSMAKTPHYSQFFGGAAPVMTASQLINQTQQPSSPPPNDFVHSDPIDQRPSPGAERSSPSLIWFSNSSPDLGRGTRPSTAPGEPRAVYRSMQESQALRARKAFPIPNVVDREEDDFDQESYNTKKRRIRRTLSENALQVKAPARPGSRHALKKSSRRSDVLDWTTPALARRQRVQFEELDSPDVENEDGRLEDEDEQLEEAEDVEEPLHDEDYVSTPLGSIQEDVYDEFSQNIVGQTNEAELDDASTVASIEQNEDGTGTTRAQEHQHVGQSTQRSTIADSQPDGQQASHATIIRHLQHSSNASFVPGSQHAGKTSEDQALLAPSSQRRSQMRVAASQVDREDSSKIPSSPPLLGFNSTLPDISGTLPGESAEGSSLARQDPVEESKSSATPCEIPESDLAGNDAAVSGRPQLSRAAQTANGAAEMNTETAGDRHANESLDATRDAAPFSTARTHVSGSLQSPRKPSQSQRSYVTDPSPRKLAGVRRFADFDTNGMSTNVSFDLEADVDDVMQGVITEEDQQVWERTNDFPDPARRSKRRKFDSQGASRTTLTNSNKARHSERPAKSVLSEEGIHNQETIVIARPESPPTALRDSPSKANEMQAPLAQGASKAVLDDVMSESVMQREKAGSDAVSQLVRKRGNTKKTKQLTYSRTSRRTSSKTGAAPTKKAPQTNNSAQDQESEEVPTATTDDQTINEVTAVVVEDEDGEKILSPKPNPDRVFALFKGHPPAYYPATWIASHGPAMSKIRFDDGTETTIETQQVMRLDLRVDDTIKVNVPGLRNKTWRVAGFGAVEPGMVTDANGQVRVQIQAKGGRDSLPKVSSEAADEGNREVLIEYVYLTSTMWPSFKDRMFIPPTARLTTVRAETPLATIAKSRGHLRGDTPASFSLSGHGIFSGMAFAVSYIHHEAEKADVTRLIGRHGGMILDGGFEELFELPNIGEAQIKSPKKSPRKQTDVDGDGAETGTGLRLKAEYRDLGFVALIADKHSRRAKYMQALALGLPTLSGRWILDSLDSSKNSSVDPLPWGRFLLPAGESAYLGGAIRSRTLPTYAIPTATLEATITARTTLLNGESVLIVAPKKDKAGWEKRRTYAFLTLALGAGRVKRVFDLEEAKALIQEDPQESKWLYVDGSVAKAQAVLFDKGKSGKRKRGDVAAAKSNVRIVDDEFVVQSLILGALYE